MKKIVDSVKKKLKRKKFIETYKGILISSVIVGCLIADGVFLTINPFLSIGFLVAALCVGIAGGISYIFKDNAKAKKDVEEATKDLDAVTSVSRESLNELDNSLKNATTKEERKYIEKRKKLVEKALEEQDDEMELSM